MIIRGEAKGAIIDKANNFSVPEEVLNEENEKRMYFKTEFSKEIIAKLDKEHFFQGKGIKQGNFTYELEWNSYCLGSIVGGSDYKFWYKEDFDRIKKVLVKILSAKPTSDEFYTKDGELTNFSNEIVQETNEIKGIGRAFIGKVLSTYFENVFINIFGHQDIFLEKIYHDYKPELYCLELFLRNNYLLLEIKNKYTEDLSNDEFTHLLYKTFDLTRANKSDYIEIVDELKIEALEVQHYQSLIHRNFFQLFNGQLKYHDEER